MDRRGASTDSFGWLTTERTQVPQPAFFAFAVACTMHRARFVLCRDPLEAGSFWAMAVAFVVFHGERYGWYPAGFFASGGLILILSLLQSAHHRTHRDELTGIGGWLAYDER
jgi:hypothetical protein